MTTSQTIPGLVPEPPLTGYGELGYSRGLIRKHTKGYEYVVRKCEGCGVELEFAPQAGFKRMIECGKCLRTTSWRLLV